VSRLFLGLLVALVVALSAASGSPAAAPQRIISLSPTATESLFAIGAGKQVVAVDDQSDYPKQAPRTTLSGFTPNVEAIAGYRPDLVVAVGTGIYEARQTSRLRNQVQTVQQQQSEQIQQLSRERDDATNQLATLRNENERLNRNTAELLKLRGEVGVLRRQRELRSRVAAIVPALQYRS
jgi:ABC-type Fe3+-hydroxamate transport system substrate-binding protein